VPLKREESLPWKATKIKKNIIDQLQNLISSAHPPYLDKSGRKLALLFISMLKEYSMCTISSCSLDTTVSRRRAAAPP
jgi:hypothetical protein